METSGENCIKSRVFWVRNVRDSARLQCPDMHIRWQQLAAAFAVEKPGHMDGAATRSFQFFDQTGAAAFKVFLNFGGPISPEREEKFVELRSKFKR